MCTTGRFFFSQGNNVLGWFVSGQMSLRFRPLPSKTLVSIVAFPEGDKSYSNCLPLI